MTEDGLHLDVLAQSESVFALSNGHIGLRGNLDEGEPHALPGTYLNGFYETRPLPYAEAGYGYPEDGQTVVNVTNGKLIRLLVDDEPLDVRYGEVLSHTRALDLRAGVLTRELCWRSPSGREVEVRSVRLVSFVQRSIAAIRYEVGSRRRAAPRRRPVDADRERAGSAAQRRPARRRGARRAARRGGAGAARRARRARAPDAPERSADGRRDGPRGRRPRRHRDRLRHRAGPRARARQLRAAGRRAPDAHEVPRLRLVEPALAAGGARPGRRRARVGEARRLGRAGRRASASTSTTSGTGPTSRSTATTSCSRRSASASSTCCRPARGPSAGRSRPRA